MNVSDLIKELKLDIYASGDIADKKPVIGCYIGDLLSLAMKKVTDKAVWITTQTNINVVAVASLRDASCVIVAEGFRPDENTIKKAETEGIVLLGSSMSAYKIASLLFKLGL